MVSSAAFSVLTGMGANLRDLPAVDDPRPVRGLNLDLIGIVRALLMFAILACLLCESRMSHLRL